MTQQDPESYWDLPAADQGRQHGRATKETAWMREDSAESKG